MPYRKTDNRIQHCEEMKEKLLNSAVEILTAKGFKALTVRKTIEAAATSNGNFYFYFKDKDDLLDQLVQRELEKLGNLIDKAGELAGNSDSGIYGVLASMMYTGVCLGLQDIKISKILLIPELRTKSNIKLRSYMFERTRNVLSNSHILPEGLSASMAAVLWQGALLTVIEEFRNSDMPDTEIAVQATVWNLLAVGVNQESIHTCVSIAQNVWEKLSSSSFD